MRVRVAVFMWMYDRSCLKTHETEQQQGDERCLVQPSSPVIGVTTAHEIRRDY